MKNTLFIVVLFVLPLDFVQGQSRSHPSDTSGISSFATFGLRYKSDYYYMGRADSAKAPYLIPSTGYYHKSGLFISGSLSYLTAEGDNRVDLYTLSCGYDYFGRKLAAGIALDQYFFSDESYSVQAEMRTYASGYIGYDLNAFMVVADASLGISDDLDVFLGGEISRTFDLMHDHLRIRPSFYTNLGTQRYYNEYYTKRTLTTGSGMGGDGKGRGSGGSGGNGSSTSTAIAEIRVQEFEKFEVLDYELELQMSYKINRLRVMTSGTFLFPVNPATIETEDGTYEEDIDNGFVWTLGLRYRLDGK